MKRNNVFGLCCLLLLACNHRDAPVAAPPSLRDPMVVAADGLSPANGFDGLGSLFPGSGWGRPQGNGGPDEWGSMAWVVGREAVVHTLLPPGPPMDFFARCLPYPWDAQAPLQSM
ncbi:MAG TPA: hypothetical protein VLR69_03575, partial [Thermoanaerobaculia bacterium]|nr:hypothetical protein [Thermoanaerobaculia bacterium]